MSNQPSTTPKPKIDKATIDQIKTDKGQIVKANKIVLK